MDVAESASSSDISLVSDTYLHLAINSVILHPRSPPVPTPPPPPHLKLPSTPTRSARLSFLCNIPNHFKILGLFSTPDAYPSACGAGLFMGLRISMIPSRVGSGTVLFRGLGLVRLSERSSNVGDAPPWTGNYRLQLDYKGGYAGGCRRHAATHNMRRSELLAQSEI